MLEILLVDDNPTFVSSMRASLALLPGVRVVGHAYHGGEALEQAALLKPDVILMDIAMPVLNGLDASRKLMAWEDPPLVIFLSMHDGPEYRDAALREGGHAFITKSNFVVELIPLITSLAQPLNTDPSSHAAHHPGH